MKSAWVLETQDSALANESCGIHPLIAHILHQRGIIGNHAQQKFLNPSYQTDVHDPFLFSDMEKAVARLCVAIRENEKITIYGDYDVDGVCATSILYETLLAFGAHTDVIINHREREGYGIHLNALKQCKERGTTLIITNDSGITNTQEIAYAQSAGIDVIITDHHEPPGQELIPNAFAIIHPRVFADSYPFKSLCGAGVAFKLVQACMRTSELREKIESKGSSAEAFEKWLLDLVYIATIADCVPLLGENRALAHFGGIVLKKTKRPGLRSLCQLAKIHEHAITSHTIAFQIAPRINAASRMEHGKIAFELLTTYCPSRAYSLAKTLDESNIRRRKLTEEIVKKARIALKSQFEEGKKILVGVGTDWPAGVLGLVASRLMNEYQRTVVLVTQSPAGRVGAARSVHSIHIANIFKKIEHLFQRYGGHAAAGGFALKAHIDERAMTKHFHDAGELEILPDELPKPQRIDAEISLKDVSLEIIESIKKLEPHGLGNEKPKFLIRNVSVQGITFVGAGEKHVRLEVSCGNITKRAIGFSLAQNAAELKIGDRADIIAQMDIHEWRDIREPQLTMLDFEKV